MADFDYDALSDLTLTLEAEDGSEVNLEMLYIFEYDDVDYAAFTEQDNPEPVIYFFTLTIGEPAEGEEEAEITFECVEDETLGNELLAIFTCTILLNCLNCIFRTTRSINTCRCSFHWRYIFLIYA